MDAEFYRRYSAKSVLFNRDRTNAKFYCEHSANGDDQKSTSEYKYLNLSQSRNTIQRPCTAKCWKEEIQRVLKEVP